ncbi:hypothetical protein NNO07_06065 [Pseudomonas resinovorans]|uniref:Uncharacterized protein n=1 Tax=Metapseudomonas resinovorans TaxID=53412 RepID=A0ABT4Y1B8_METRE|nr:hypothetical protein [Pseudomonas resinovorans]MDA8482628.1 hypothetical protein [Pseudomonas resinovorans]
MNSLLSTQLARLLSNVRYSHHTTKLGHFMHFAGYLDGLRDFQAVDADTIKRLDLLGFNAFVQNHGRRCEVEA